MNNSNPDRRRDRSTHLRRNSNAAHKPKHDKTALKEEVEKLLKSAGLECAFNPASNQVPDDQRNDPKFLHKVLGFARQLS
mgnify:CR=1 FL=1